VGDKLRLADLKYFLALELPSELIFRDHTGEDKLIDVDDSKHEKDR